MHTTHSIIMVPPVDFAFNEQTGQDNEFQQPSDLPLDVIRDDALSEFNEMVNILRDHHVEVLLLNKQHDTPPLPDAVFPNNWFSTDNQGSITLYPMKTLNRQAEIRPHALSQLLERNHYKIKHTKTIEHQNQVLEGTGSIIFDHNNTTAYAALSERCDEQLFNNYCQTRGYQAISFQTAASSGKPFYHTNVMMSIGDSFVVICSEAIISNQEQVLNKLSSHHKQIIDISLEQAEKSFCANILQLHNLRNEKLIVMSESAYNGFSKAQRNQLEKHGTLVRCPIPTIETIGGGSARCMIAENFLPR